MRNVSWAFVVLMLFIYSGAAVAEPEIPDLRGTWTGDFTIVRTIPPKNVGPNPLAFTKPGFHRASGVTYKIDKQEGPVFSGTESFANSKQIVVGVIQQDNKKVYMVDRYGTLTGEIIAADKIRIVYLENTEHGQVAARGTITRTKPLP